MGSLSIYLGPPYKDPNNGMMCKYIFPVFRGYLVSPRHLLALDRGLEAMEGQLTPSSWRKHPKERYDIEDCTACRSNRSSATYKEALTKSGSRSERCQIILHIMYSPSRQRPPAWAADDNYVLSLTPWYIHRIIIHGYMDTPPRTRKRGKLPRIGWCNIARAQ